jgi:hypothetical protein
LNYRLNQREQVILRLNDWQRPLIVAQAFSYAPTKFYGNAIRHKSTNELAHSGRPRDTTPRQDMYIRRQHMYNRFTRATTDNWQPPETN